MRKSVETHRLTHSIELSLSRFLREDCANLVGSIFTVSENYTMGIPHKCSCYVPLPFHHHAAS